jgi:predicted Fe-Mo cluster-binding NifX family protein
MKKKIAIPLENGLLCVYFGHCQTFAIVDVENDQITEIYETSPPGHVPGLVAKWVAQFGITDVIAGRMGKQAIKLFNQYNINVFVGAPTRPAKELVSDFLMNELSLVAYYCNHDVYTEFGNFEH